MNPPRQRKGSGPAKAALVQDRPAEPAQARQTASEPEPDMFPPNPVPSVREGRPAAYKRYLKVTGPKEVGGVLAPGWLTLDLTDAQLEALQAGGHVVDYPAGAGWGSDSSEDAESDADGPAGDAKPEPKDEPKAGADKEGN